MDILIENVTICFPTLFKARAFKDGDKPQFEATLVFDPKENAVSLKRLQDAMVAEAKAKWGEKAAEVFKQLQAGQKICLKSNDLKAGTEGFPEGGFFVRASSQSAPKVFDLDPKIEIKATDADRIYAGCKVNAALSIWAMDNQYGRRICATLLGVQYVSDGERLSGSTSVTGSFFPTLAAPTMDSPASAAPVSSKATATAGLSDDIAAMF